ncbi:MAG: hypothetical protein US89_C0012G0013 [Candidatus Peregrinibacteria bacterium GW2011_GWF2_38_29]|nr:MAG: hypothetical protein US89_C0012G0013 [Candidatus Peregrinibacteria bacterium GW2011_GWF2_38_29]HBB02483.1 hypothetical protein [Candidatus Peregrinibacteria bacterium]
MNYPNERKEARTYFVPAIKVDGIEHLQAIEREIAERLTQAGFTAMPYSPTTMAYTKTPTVGAFRSEPVVLDKCVMGGGKPGLRVITRQNAPDFDEASVITNSVISAQVGRQEPDDDSIGDNVKYSFVAKTR